MLPDAEPKLTNFVNSIPENDHYGPPLLEYHEDIPSDGFLQICTATVYDELFDDSELDSTAFDDSVSMEECPSVEEKNITSPLDDDALDLHPSLDLPPNESPTDITEVTEQQTDTSSGKCPLLFDDEAYHEKPILEGRSKRTIKKRTIWDPSDIALHVEHVLNDIEVPIGNVTDETLEKCSAPTESILDSVEGADPTPFLPEPQSLKGVLRLPEKIKKAWIKAYCTEFTNMIVTKKTFSHPKNYR
jgi:hypothetical protein